MINLFIVSPDRNNEFCKYVYNKFSYVHEYEINIIDIADANDIYKSYDKFIITPYNIDFDININIELINLYRHSIPFLYIQNGNDRISDVWNYTICVNKNIEDNRYYLNNAKAFNLDKINYKIFNKSIDKERNILNIHKHNITTSIASKVNKKPILIVADPFNGGYDIRPQIDFYNKFKSKLNDTVIIVTNKTSNLKLIDGMECNIIPSFSIGTLNNPNSLDPKFNLSSLTKSNLEKLVFINYNKSRYEYILFGNAGPELNSSKKCNLNLYNSVKFFVSKFSGFIDKMAFAPFDNRVDLEASLYENDLDNAPFRRYLIDNNKPLFLFCGFTYLYHNGFDMYKNGYFKSYDDLVNGKVGYTTSIYEFLQLKQGKNTHFKKYISGIKTYSGFGEANGARNHHYSNLINYGFDNAMFYAPQAYDDFDNKELFLRDVCEQDLPQP